MSRVTRWWWIRHAPVAAPAGRLYGRSDVAADISDTDSLAALAAALPDRAVWLASPLQRATRTAEALLAAGGRENTECRAEPEFMEQDFGAWEGRGYDTIAADFWDDPAGNRPPGGESFVDLVARVAAAIGRWNGEARGRHIVAVAHAGVIRAALAHALAPALAPDHGGAAAEALRFAVDPLSLTRLEHFVEKSGERTAWSVVCVNRPAANPANANPPDANQAKQAQNSKP